MCPNVIITLLHCLLVIRCLAQEQSAYVTITPSTLTLENNMTSVGGTVTIQCRGSSTLTGQSSNLYSLKLSRVLDIHPNATPTILLSILHHNLSPQVIYPIEGSSSLGSVTQNFLTLRLARARCEDAGVYLCEAAYLNTDVTTASTNHTLTVLVKPGQMSISAEPGYRHWVVNHTVTLTCTGALGSASNDTQFQWHWEFWDAEDHSWRRYDGHASDIVVEDTNQQPCYMNGTSTLTRRLRLADSERVYRCYVERDGVPYSEFAGRFQIGSVLSVVTDSALTERYDLGLAVGASIGVGSTTALVLAIVFTVVLCARRKCRVCTTENVTKVNVRSKTDRVTPSPLKKVQTRNVALQTTIMLTTEDKDNEGYDVIDNSGGSVAPLHHAPPPPRPPSSSAAAASHVSRSLEQYEDGLVCEGHVVDLAAAQQQQAAAEDVLRILLATRHVVSWKVSAERGLTTFVLYLTADNHEVAHQGVQHGRWRKKSAAARQQQQQHLLEQRVALPVGGGEGVEGGRHPLALREVPISLGYESPRR